MNPEQIKEKVLEWLEALCNEDPKKIQADIDTLGDAEIDSIYFVEIAPMLAQDLGISITPQDIDQHAKRSFNNFCGLLTRLVTGQR